MDAPESTTVSERLDRARVSLEGLALGDAFGCGFFVQSDLVERFIAERALPGPPWTYTDDTQMALSVVGCLARFGRIDQDWLARSFAEHYDVNRGYGPAMHRLLRKVREGVPWRHAARAQFGGQGSFGNGAAMRVAPLGAYFADDLDAVVDQAVRSAEVTHAHPEGIAGGVAVALAAAWTWRLRGVEPAPSRVEFLDLVQEATPESEVRGGIRRAMRLDASATVRLAVAALGNGEGLSAQDTVPFALWCAAGHLDDYEAALWTTVSGLGDRDTTCAIVGGIVVGATGEAVLPLEWLGSREALPAWPVSTDQDQLVTLYRPVGPKELALIEASGWRAFPPRLPEQPIFYPVLDEAYAIQIARDWNAKDPSTGFRGYVTRFHVRRVFLERHPVRTAGGRQHREYWVPADELEAFNASLVGPIDVIHRFEPREHECGPGAG